MNARAWITGLAVAGVVLAASTGCGGGAKALPKASLIAKADSLCRTGGNQVSAIPTPSNIHDPIQAAAYFDKFVPIITRVTAALAALKPPGDVKADWDAFVTLQQQEDAALIAIQHKADANDASGLVDLRKIPALNQRVSAAATKVGATGCVD